MATCTLFGKLVLPLLVVVGAVLYVVRDGHDNHLPPAEDDFDMDTWHRTATTTTTTTTLEEETRETKRGKGKDDNEEEGRSDGGEGENGGAHRYRFGRYLQPMREVFLPEVDEEGGLSATWQRWTKLKRWHFVSVVDERYFLGVALVQFNYVANAFLYVVDRATGRYDMCEYGELRPLGAGLDFAPSSVDGCSSWRRDMWSSSSSSSSGGSGDEAEAASIRICYEESRNGWRVVIKDVVCQRKASQGTPDSKSAVISANISVSLEDQDALAILFPLDRSQRRPAYVHKQAGLPATGDLTIDGVKHTFSNALAVSDWTKSLAKRRTQWKWASFCGVAEVRLRSLLSEKSAAAAEPAEASKRQQGKTNVGINLSSDVYDFMGSSAENGIWIDGELFALPKAVFAVPADPVHEEWTVSGTGIDLTVQPFGSREDHTKVLGLLESDFVQAFGLCNGKIVAVSRDGKTEATVFLRDFFGVVEDHHALW